MTSYEFEVSCKNLIIEHNMDRYPELKIDGVDLVWFSKTLKNKKALVIITDDCAKGDGIMYEITYNGELDCWYFDEYKKQVNKKIELQGNEHLLKVSA